jgi:uncharacterized repeat protein (TIGR02543 family)
MKSLKILALLAIIISFATEKKLYAQQESQTFEIDILVGVGDSVVIKVGQYTGEYFQWQKSTNNVVWLNIPESSTDSLVFIPENTTTTFFRLRVVAGNCDPFYSEIAKIRVGNYPTVTTTVITNITATSAATGGTITATGGTAIIARGVCWGTEPNPSLNGSFTTNGSGGGSFASFLTGLNSSTAYYVRAYATNSVGTAYGQEISFTTLPLFTLTLAASPAQAGTVSGGGVFEANAQRSLTATANSNFVFVNWTNESSEIVSTAANFTFTMPAANTILTANFVPSYTLTLVSSPAGSAVLTGAGQYLGGTTVAVAATPNSGFVFVNWTNQSGTVVSNVANFTYTMPAANSALTANFAPLFALTLAANPTNGGNVTGAGNYVEGTEVALTATPNSGFVFVNWTNQSGTVVSNVANFTYTMPAANSTLTANFEVDSGK